MESGSSSFFSHYLRRSCRDGKNVPRLQWCLHNSLKISTRLHHWTVKFKWGHFMLFVLCLSTAIEPQTYGRIVQSSLQRTLFSLGRPCSSSSTSFLEKFLWICSKHCAFFPFTYLVGGGCRLFTSECKNFFLMMLADIHSVKLTCFNPHWVGINSQVKESRCVKGAQGDKKRNNI